MSFLRKDIEFPSDAVTCRAWLYQPVETVASARPCIVMAHGLGGTRDAGLEPFAEAFAKAGYVVLLFDYRHFGSSDGMPRQLLSVRRQLRDWQSAIDTARELEGVDPKKIALWGSSFSGGHVVVAAAKDARVAAVVAQGPMMDGLAAVMNVARYAGISQILRLSGVGLLDQLLGLFGLGPVYVPLVATPGQLAAMSSQDAEPGYRAITPPHWRNEMAARLALVLAAYRPIRYADQVTCPALVQVCMNDSVAPARSAIATAKRMGERCQLKCYEGMGHFDIYVGAGFEQAVGDQLRFFDSVLPV